MEQVVETLVTLGVRADMTSWTVECQRAIGNLGLVPPVGLAAKVAAMEHVQDPTQ